MRSTHSPLLTVRRRLLQAEENYLLARATQKQRQLALLGERIVPTELMEGA